MMRKPTALAYLDLSNDAFEREIAAGRLIAAAPDLLEALEWIAANYENCDMNHVDFRVEAKHRAEAAITKALAGNVEE